MANLMRQFSLVPMIFGDMEKELGRLWGRETGLPTTELADWQPKIDIIEEPKQFIVKVDVPGVEAKDIDINIDGNTLIIKGERESEHKEKKDNFVRYERSKGSFYRSIMLPDIVDAGKISAKNKNGVLEVTLPKSEKSTQRKIIVEE